MKKKFILAALPFLMLSLAGCKDEEPTEGGSSEASTQDQYLVMLYGVGGQTLDYGIAGNILQSLNTGSSDKVKITYQYRFSNDFQSPDSSDVYKNILRFTADENKGLVGKVDTKKTVSNKKYVYDTFKANINTTHIGDSTFIMASDTALTSFIKWSKAKYPNAKKTILVLTDHGGGWNLIEDGKRDYNTRAIIYDDNTRGADGNDLYFSLEDVKRGVVNAGKVDAIYDDACLMSTWENLLGYADMTTYFVGSLETAPGIGGNHEFLVNNLKEAEVTDDGLKSAMQKYIDNVIDDWWGMVNKDPERLKIYGDLACYDLRKIETPLAVLADIRKTLVEKYNDQNNMPGLTDTLYGRKWCQYIDAAISGCEIATTSLPFYVSVNLVPAPMLTEIQKDGIKPKYNKKWKCDTYYAGDLLYYLERTSFTNKEVKTYMEQYKKLWEVLAQATTDSYPVSDLLDVLCKFISDAGSTDVTFSDLDTRYITALKDFGYIRCTMPIQCTYDCAYQLCSPGVFIFPLSQKEYANENNFTSRYYKKIPTAAEALKYYQATQFDQRVKWSEFLQIIDRAPDVVGNPSRKELY